MEHLCGRHCKRSKSERGVALIMALFVLAILSLVGITVYDKFHAGDQDQLQQPKCLSSFLCSRGWT